MVIPPYSNKAGTYLIPTCILGAISLVLVITRIYTRVTRTKKLYLDDWLIIIAEVCSTLSHCCHIAIQWHIGILSNPFRTHAKNVTASLFGLPLHSHRGRCPRMGKTCCIFLPCESENSS